MLPWRKIDSTVTADGGELSLEQRGGDFVIRIDGQELMSSRAHGSEDALGAHGCAALAKKRGARVLIGGLGLGYTARAALDVLGPSAEVEVVELAAAVIRWNREICAPLAGRPLEDARVRVSEGDVASAIAAADRRYDAILLDVDNGPSALCISGNKKLYGAEGLARAARALRPGGMLAVWSASDDRKFTTRLTEAGFEVRTQHVRGAHGGNRRHMLWLARLPCAEAGRW